MIALLIIDLQNDFLPGGALGVKDGNQLVPIINGLMNDYTIIIATQDWHPAHHGSFASNHPGKNPYDQITLAGLPQTLWPAHCIQNTTGAEFAPGLQTERFTAIFQKGQNPDIDSYSGFYDNGHKQDTGLAGFLRKNGITEVHLCGIATDYCVKFTALDALTENFKTTILTNACRGVNLSPDDIDNALQEIKNQGGQLI